ncbi:MAG TPA: ATP-binding protein [Terriglobales bacterium]|nr:ATP-binding protein [Terriglobales bacterium]
MTRRIFFKLFAFFFLVIAVAAVTIDFTVREAWEQSLYRNIEQNLSEKVAMFAERVRAASPEQYGQVARDISMAAAARATIIDSSGKVLADSEANPQEMENHASRQEFLAALTGKKGESSRVSHTVGVEFLYLAAPIPNGAVRLAYPLSEIKQVNSHVRRSLFKSTALAMFVALILAAIASRVISTRLRSIMRFAEKIAAGDLTARIDPGDSSDEIAQVAAALDRTARRLEQSFQQVELSHKELETLLNSMEEGVLATSADRRVIWANRKMQQLLPAGVRIGAPLVETLRDPDLLRAAEAAATAENTHTERISWASAGKSFSVTAAPMPGGGVVVVLYDLSEIERLERTRRDFIANVSHELRTPLTSIQGYTETLLDGLPSDPKTTHEFLEIIRKNAARMSRLTQDLLTLARVESGEQSFRFEAVPASSLLHDAEQNLHDLAVARGISLRVASSTEETVQADRDAIHQVFTNLVDNAIKYAPGGTEVLLGARVSDQFVEFYVQDFGPGIPSEHLSRLFERFYRVDKARSVESGGTGLGLAIVKHIVRKHGGTVAATSTLNRGSEFSFRLPLALKPAEMARA